MASGLRMTGIELWARRKDSGMDGRCWPGARGGGGGERVCSPAWCEGRCVESMSAEVHLRPSAIPSKASWFSLSFLRTSIAQCWRVFISQNPRPFRNCCAVPRSTAWKSWSGCVFGNVFVSSCQSLGYTRCHSAHVGKDWGLYLYKQWYSQRTPRPSPEHLENSCL